MEKKFVTFKLWQDEDGNWTDKETGEATEFRVTRPNRRVEQSALIEYNKELRQLLEKRSGFLLRAEVSDLLKERELWSKDKELRYKELQREVSNGVAKLTRGGIKKDEAYDVAVSVVKKRGEASQLDGERNMLDGQTAEAKAEETKFNYYIYACTTYNESGRLVFADLSFEEFLNSEDTLIGFAGVKLMELFMGMSLDKNKQPEWKFLERHGYTDEKGRLKDKTKSYLVNLDGRRINDKGQFLNENDEVVDEFGNVQVDMDKVEFLD